MGHRLVVFGLSITSSWGNGHATTYRGLLGALAARGWEIAFFERDVDWYRNNRDLVDPFYCTLRLYPEWAVARAEADAAVRAADAVLVGSYAGQAQEIIDWLATRDRPTFFYDIDTPITLTALQRAGEAEYLRSDQIPLFAVYFSFTGGPALRELEEVWGARSAEALYCGVDPPVYHPVPPEPRYTCTLGYMGTYAPDRLSKLQEMLIQPARELPDHHFIIAGSMYPDMNLPNNVKHFPHVYPKDHAAFYSSNRATLNLTREAMARYGWSPSVRLFEAAACGACIVSDTWPGLDHLLEPGAEVLLAANKNDVLGHLAALTPERRTTIGRSARRRVLEEHTYGHRAAQFESAYQRVLHATRSIAGQ